VKAIVVSAGEAVFAVPAGYRGLDGHTHPFTMRRDARPGSHNNAHRLMAKHHGIGGAAMSHAAVQIPMKIASTDADLVQSDEYFARTRFRRVGDIPQFQPALPDKLNAEHFQSPQYIVRGGCRSREGLKH
jgi:hypothetical protein